MHFCVGDLRKPHRHRERTQFPVPRERFQLPFPCERFQLAFPWERPQFPVSRERVPGGAASLSKRPIPPTSLSLFAERINDLYEWSSNYLNHSPRCRPHQRPDLDLGDHSDGTEMNSGTVCLWSAKVHDQIVMPKTEAIFHHRERSDIF
jgi:hypothetical protein